MLLTSKAKNIPITDNESVVLRTAIESQIEFRLSNKISSENGEDIILLRNVLENINKLFPI